MNSLPLHLLDDILFRLEPKSVALMRCTSRSINSHICEDPVFETEYFSRFGSSLYNLSAATGASEVFCHPLVSSCKSMSLGKRTFGSYSFKCFILGSCSGLLLLYIDGLFVVNPLTKSFRFLDCSGSKFIPTLFYGLGRGGLCFLYKYSFESMCVGFAVDGIRTNKRFKIVCILEMQTRYAFEISDGDSWRLSKTSIIPGSKSDLMMRMKPVYLHGTLHWLRKDGSIIAFDPETEQARFIPSTFHHELLLDMELLFAADDKTNRLTLIAGTKKTISVYILLENSKWIFVRQFKNVTIENKYQGCWNLVLYDGNHLVVREEKGYVDGVMHVYDMEATSWGVLGSISRFAGIYWDFYKFTPSFFPVEEGKHNSKAIVASNDHRILYLNAIMGLVN